MMGKWNIPIIIKPGGKFVLLSVKICIYTGCPKILILEVKNKFKMNLKIDKQTKPVMLKASR